MQQYQSKSSGEEVEAIQLTSENVSDVVAWTKGQQVEEVDPITQLRYVGINIQTVEGKKRASNNDWVVKASIDEDHPTPFFYPWKPGAFENEFLVIE